MSNYQWNVAKITILFFTSSSLLFGSASDTAASSQELTMRIMSYADYKMARHSPVSYDSLSDPRSIRGYVQVIQVQQKAM